MTTLLLHNNYIENYARPILVNDYFTQIMLLHLRLSCDPIREFLLEIIAVI